MTGDALVYKEDERSRGGAMVVAAALDLLRSASLSCSRLRVSDATNVFGLSASAR